MHGVKKFSLQLEMPLRVLSGFGLFTFFLLCGVMLIILTPRKAAGETEAAFSNDLLTRSNIKKTVNNAFVTDDMSVYTKDGYGDDYSIVYMYMTVRRGNNAENSDTPWDELAKHSTLEYTALGVERDRVECILQEGDLNGPLEGFFGFNASVPNGVVNIRGSTTSESSQKSYKGCSNRQTGRSRKIR
jgi:spore coat protein H